MHQKQPPANVATPSVASAIAAAVAKAHLVIGAVLVPGAATPKLVSREMIRTMKRGSVVAVSPAGRTPIRRRARPGPERTERGFDRR